MKWYQKLGIGAALIASFAGGYVTRSIDSITEESCAQAVQKRTNEIFSDVAGAQFLAEGEVYMEEGFEFSPGGGYFYYPNGNGVLSKEQKKEISDRLEEKLIALRHFKREMGKREKKYR